MRRIFFLLVLLTVSALTACAQVYMMGWSYVYAEQNSGAIWTEGYTYVYNPDPLIGEYGTDYNAYTQGYLSPTGSNGYSTTNNCGQGCALYWFEDQVPYLGVTLTLTSYHQGWGYDVSLGNFWMWQMSSSNYNIPSSVPLVFTGIDARNPDNVWWGVSTNGLPAPWQINFYMPGVYQIVSGSYAQTNQMQYPDGQSPGLPHGDKLRHDLRWSGLPCQCGPERAAPRSYLGPGSRWRR